MDFVECSIIELAIQVDMVEIEISIDLHYNVNCIKLLNYQEIYRKDFKWVSYDKSKKLGFNPILEREKDA